MKGKAPLLALIAAAAAAAVAWSKRPVKPPSTAGTWAPADSERTKR